MTCSDRRDQILLYAAGQLDPAEADALRAHLPLAIPLESPSPASRERLMQRILSNATTACQRKA